jgi:hypothetical protein
MTSTFSRRASLALSAGLVALTIAACGGSTATTTPATAAPASVAPSAEPSASASASAAASAATSPGASLATTGRIEVPEHGFAVTLPAGWTRIDLQSGDLEAIMAAAGAENPELAKLYTAQIQTMLASGLVIFAFGPDITTGTNLNILSLPSMGMSLDLLEQANLAQLQSLADGQVSSERVTLPAGEALHLRYTIAAANQPVSPTIDQYLVLSGDRQLMVSVTNASAADAAAIANSIELLS